MDHPVELAHVIPAQQVRSQRFLMRVVEAAERILRRDGAGALTMPNVAQEAGVSVGGIYRRFQNKQDLLRAVKDRYLNTSDEEMAAAMSADYESLGEVVRAFLATLIKANDNLIGLILENQHDDKVMATRGNASVDSKRRAFAEALAPFRERITHPEPDLAIETAYIMAMSVYLRHTRASARGGEVSWTDLRRELARLMLSYLLWPADRKLG